MTISLARWFLINFPIVIYVAEESLELSSKT